MCSNIFLEGWTNLRKKLPHFNQKIKCIMLFISTSYNKQFAKLINIFTWPLESLPLYTRPNPPSPKKHSGLKLFVALASSRKVNVCAAIWASGKSFGPDASFLGPTLLLDFSLSPPAKCNQNQQQSIRNT